MNAVCKCLFVVLLLSAGLALAQRAVIVGVKRDTVAAYADDSGRQRLDPVPAAQLGQRPSVLETSLDESLVRVLLGGRSVWLDRNALQLGSDVNAACHQVASSHGAPPAGAARGANGNCPLPIKTGGK